MSPRLPVWTACLLAFASWLPAAEPSPQAGRGRDLYATACSMCHQPDGRGARGVYPPLAGADYLLADRERSIRIVLQGMGGAIEVNGQTYNGVMPPPALADDDQKVADVLTYVRSAWGNGGDAVSADEVKAVRAKLADAALADPDPFAPLPTPPAGFRLREAVRLPVNGVRLASMPGVDWLLVVHNHGDVYRLDPASGDLALVLRARDYAGGEERDAYGMTIDSRKRLYVVTNRRVATTPFHTNDIVVYRSEPLGADGVPAGVKPWLHTAYPYGVGPYNHGVGHIAQGPDGMIYLASGSRTDGGEPGTDPSLWSGGETPLTAGIWRLDPEQSTPAITMHARGIRNAWVFAWNAQGELFSASNGPDADQPEELERIEPGRHYGFPYRFSDAPGKVYPHTPDAPAGLEFEAPIRNFGPAGGGSPDRPMATFEPHSSPAGMAFCGDDWPEAYRGKCLIGRFGNLIKERDVGYDVLAVSLTRNAAGVYEARTETFLAPVARPTDLLQKGRRLYLLEYTRTTNHRSGRPMSPGRILELSW